MMYRVSHHGTAAWFRSWSAAKQHADYVGVAHQDILAIPTT